MKNRGRRLPRGKLLQFVSVVFAVVMGCAVLLLVLLRTPLQTQAKYLHFDVGTAQNSPSSGPVGAIISVSGSGWQSVPDGTLVSFGYSTSTNCSAGASAGNEQLGKMAGGSFSGWFQWPSGTLLNMYTVCAFIGNITAPANTYTVQSTSPPQISASPSPLIVGQRGTVTGVNYLPAGTFVPIVLQSGSSSDVLGSALSDANGSFSLAFTVPSNILGSGTITANAGKGQPPTLSSSAPVTIKSQSATPTPSPPPKPTPTPVPTSTPIAFPAATPMPAPTATRNHTGSTPTAMATNGTTSTPIPVATINPGSSSTPTLGSTAIVNQNNAIANTTSTSRQNGLFSPLIIGAGTGILLLAFLGTMLLLLWRRSQGRGTQAVMPASAIQPWMTLPIPDPNLTIQGQFMLNNDEQPLTMNGDLGGNSVPAISMNDVQMLPINGSGMPPTAPPTKLMQFASLSDFAVMNGAAAGANGTSADDFALAPANNTSVQQSAPLDPALEAAMRQAQMGLFATPHQSREV